LPHCRCEDKVVLISLPQIFVSWRKSKATKIGTMNQLNRVGPDHIERLSPTQFVKLLDILLHAEAKDRLLAKHGIHVPFQITVPDGGRDGKWEAEIVAYEYIPRKLTYYQSKAQSLTEGECRAEVLRTDEPSNVTLKEKVQEVLDKGGAYVIFCSHPVAKLDERIAACRKALRDAGRQTPEDDCIEFLDANRIATWVNLHVSAFSYVNEITTNFQAVGLKDVDAWGQELMFEYEFQYNDYLANQIRDLRNWLIKPKNIARITGPSGLGKTRLGYEVFNCESLDDNKIRQVLTSPHLARLVREFHILKGVLHCSLHCRTKEMQGCGRLQIQ
jgi:hypothetical protein